MDAEKLNKSLAELDKLADDLTKSNKEAEEAAEKAKEAEEAKEAEAEKTDAGEAVEKAAKPSEISEDDDDKDKEDSATEKTKDENNNEEDNNEKLMDKNEKKAQTADKSGEEAPKDAEDEKKKAEVDEDEEEDQVSKSVEDIFEPLYKSVKAGSPAEMLVDAINKSMRSNTATSESVEKSVSDLASGLTSVIGELVKSNQQLLSRTESLERAMSNQGTMVQKSLKTQEEIVKSQPMARKSRVSVMEKSFDHSAGLSNGDGNQLSKGEVLEKLTNLVMTGDNRVTPHDVMGYESDGTLRPELEKLINN